MSRFRDRRQSLGAVLNTLPREGDRKDVNRRRTTSNLVAKSPAIFPGASITKSHTKKPKRGKTGHVIADELEEQLNTYTSTLAVSVIDNLKKAEGNLADNIDSLFTDFDKKYDLLETAESSLQFNFEREEIQLGESDGEKGPEVRVLGQCMEEYQRQIRTGADRIDDLWDEWEEAQHEILRLAMEIFGPEIVEQVTEETSDLSRDMAPSQQIHEQDSQMMEGFQNELSQIQKQLEELTGNSVGESKQHLKEIRLKNREQARVFSKAISAMEDF